MDNLDYLLEQKAELKSVMDQLFLQIDQQQEIDTQPLENLLHSFEHCLRNSSTIASLTDQVTEFQLMLSNSIQNLSEKCQIAQLQLTKMDHHHQGVRAYAQNQFLSHRKSLG